MWNTLSGSEYDYFEVFDLLCETEINEYYDTQAEDYADEKYDSQIKVSILNFIYFNLYFFWLIE